MNTGKFKFKIINAGSNKLNVVKVLRATLFHLEGGLKLSKDLVESEERTLYHDDKELLASVRKQLIEAGAECSEIETTYATELAQSIEAAYNARASNVIEFD